MPDLSHAERIAYRARSLLWSISARPPHTFLEHAQPFGERHADAHLLGRTGFAIYGLLEDHRPPQAAEASATYNEANRDPASLIEDAIVDDTCVVDWLQKDDVQREMRNKIKRQLRASGLNADEVERLAAEIVDLARPASCTVRSVSRAGDGDPKWPIN